jgi:uncharacterized Zn-binding protein involved in type VI secretion
MASRNVAKVGDQVDTGHGCDLVTTITKEASATNVYINNILAALQGTKLAEHTFPNPAVPPIPPCIVHPGQVINAGSKSVTVNGRGLARVGDSADLGRIRNGSKDVFAN